MQALYWNGKQARVTEQPNPEASEHAVVRVSLAGVCATDLEITRGYMDYRGVLGHEFVGHVESGPEDWQGARVVAEINNACRKCNSCLRGLERHCPNRTVTGILNANGAFAERIAVPVENLHRVPDNVSNDAAVFTEPLAAAFEILEQVDVQQDDRCLVFGDGRLGLLISQVLHTTGAHVTTIGKHSEKLALLEVQGIETQLLSSWEASPRQADIVVEATGNASGFARAVSAPIDLAPLVINEITVVGSRCGPFAPALDALARGTVSVEPLIAARYPLAEGEQALVKAGEAGVLKVLIDCSG
jgi:threonine dehydrogenase-like Zn-dependent dehydrogenase